MILMHALRERILKGHINELGRRAQFALRHQLCQMFRKPPKVLKHTLSVQLLSISSGFKFISPLLKTIFELFPTFILNSSLRLSYVVWYYWLFCKRWIWGIYCTQVTKHTSKEIHPGRRHHKSKTGHKKEWCPSVRRCVSSRCTCLLDKPHREVRRCYVANVTV